MLYRILLFGILVFVEVRALYRLFVKRILTANHHQTAQPPDLGVDPDTIQDADFTDISDVGSYVKNPPKKQ